MNKTDLVKKIAEKAGLSQAASKEALDAALDAIQGALKKGDSVHSAFRSVLLVQVRILLQVKLSRFQQRRLLSGRQALHCFNLL